MAKYDRNAAIKLRDVMFLCRPKPNNDYETKLFKKVADRTLTPPETWEVLLSAGEDRKETWTKLIFENKIGGLAMLRSINNMKKADVDRRVIVEGLKRLKSSMLLPLDFLKAEHIKYPQKGFGVFKQIMDTRHNIGGGGIFTKQCFRLV